MHRSPLRLLCVRKEIKKWFMIDVTLIWQKSWKVTRVTSKCNVHLSSMPDNGILSSTHLPVSEVKRSRANGGVTLVGSPDWEGKVKHWRKKSDKWWRREMGFWSQTTNDQTLFSTSAPVAEGSESNIHQDFSSAHEDFFFLFFEGWQITSGSASRGKLLQMW